MTSDVRNQLSEVIRAVTWLATCPQPKGPYDTLTKHHDQTAQRLRKLNS